MGLLDNLFKPQQEKAGLKWKTLDSESQIEVVIRDSYHKPVVIFKHSIYCGTSAMAKGRLERDWDFAAEDMEIYFLDIINYRSLSNKVEEVFEVIHQSPQMIVVKNGEAVLNLSHRAVSVEELRKIK